MHRIVCRLGFHPDPTSGAYSAPWHTGAFKGLLQREGEAWNERERQTGAVGRQKEEKEGRERKGVGPTHFSNASSAYDGTSPISQ